MLLIICAILEYVLLGVDINANLPNAWLASILLAVAFLNAFIGPSVQPAWPSS